MDRSRSSNSMTRRGLGVLPWALCVLLSGLLPVSAHGEGRGNFQVHYELALKMYETEHYSDALREFEAAYAIQQLPRLLLNIGQTHRKLGHGKEALTFCQSYLQLEPEPEPAIKSKADTCIEQSRLMIAENERIAAQQAERERAEAEHDKQEAERAKAEEAKRTAALAPTQLQAQVASAGNPLPPGVLFTKTDAPQQVPDSGKKPIYKRWWFWGALGVVAAGATTAALLTTRPWDPGTPSFQTKDALFHDITKP